MYMHLPRQSPLSVHFVRQQKDKTKKLEAFLEK